MSEKSVSEKMHIRPGMVVAALFAPDGLVARMGAPDSVAWTDRAEGADAILLFASSRAEFEQRIAQVSPTLTSKTMLWACYPKGSKAAGLDISRDTIWQYAEARGMRPVGMVSINETWSGFRLKVVA